MSIYVLRSDNLVKIGFSDSIRRRLSQIVSCSPVPVEFVGYMPGDKELEAHLHQRFATQHFAGEWFVENETMRQVFSTILTPRLPELNERESRDRSPQRRQQICMARDVQHAARALWPAETAADCISNLAEELGWKVSRAKDLYYAHQKMALRGIEQHQVETWLSSRALAYAIAPELRTDEDEP